MRRAATAALLVVSLAAPGCSDEPGGLAGYEVEEFSEYGINEHVEGDVRYRQTPPVVGPHSAKVLPCDAFEQPVPEEVMVHTLEHGAVGVLFAPDVAQEEQAAIQEYVEASDAKVFSAPFDDLPAPVMVVSWRRMMRLESFDAGVVDEYVELYENEAPEPEQECI